jgi:hypothetical protein
MGTEVAQRSTALAPAGKAPSRSGRAVMRRSGQALAANLSVFSVLDLIGQEMAALNTELADTSDQLDRLDRTAESIDIHVTNVDERSALYEAPLATRQASDAASGVAARMADLSMQVREHAYRVQMLNAVAFVALRTMREVQDSQRGIGAGSRLLRNAGR